MWPTLYTPDRASVTHRREADWEEKTVEAVARNIEARRQWEGRFRDGFDASNAFVWPACWPFRRVCTSPNARRLAAWPQRATENRTESHVAAATLASPSVCASRVPISFPLSTFASLSLSLSLSFSLRVPCFLSWVDTLSGRARETEREERRMNRKRDESERRLWPVIHSSWPRKNLPLPSIRSCPCALYIRGVCVYLCRIRVMHRTRCTRGTTRNRKIFFSVLSLWQCLWIPVSKWKRIFSCCNETIFKQGCAVIDGVKLDCSIWWSVRNNLRNNSFTARVKMFL